jgi:phosphoglycerate dehydrogenase-like enzyme
MGHLIPNKAGDIKVQHSAVQIWEADNTKISDSNKISDLKNTKIICRSGVPYDFSDLDKCEIRDVVVFLERIINNQQS